MIDVRILFLLHYPYLENEWTEFNQIFYTHYHLQDLQWNCKVSFFCKLATELRPLIDVRIWFLFNILRINKQNLTKFCILIMPPTLKKWGTYWFRLVRMCVCVCVCVCIHVRDIVLKLHVWIIPHGKIADAYFWFSLNYLPLSNYGPLTNKDMKFCKCRISKSIIARNLKLVMLIGDDD